MIVRGLFVGASVCTLASAMLCTAAAAVTVNVEDGGGAAQQSGGSDVAKRQAAKKKGDEQTAKRLDEARRKASPVSSSPRAATATGDATDADIMVVGVRSSLAQARETKRNSDAIVDVVNAEDIGKLPNNTVGDVIASIPGIATYRTEGEVDEIQLRGIGDVQTTIGGTPVESGNGRTLSIQDLPADLVKSVEVYKTKTPDQVEGGGGGQVNIEFRKPTDLKAGFTFVTNANARFNQQSRRLNQTYTGIVNYRADTAIGGVGAQFGATWNFNPFLESQARNDTLTQIQARQVVGPNLLPQPTFTPYQVAFLYTQGSRTTPNYTGSVQWTNDGNDVTIDGQYQAPYFDRFTNQLFMGIAPSGGSVNNLPALSNITLVPGTNRLASVTVSPVTQVGPITDFVTANNSSYLGRIRATHIEDRFKLYAEIALTGGESDSSQYYTRSRFVNRPVYDVEFATDKFRFPQMNLQFRDLNLLDSNQYRFFGIADNRSESSNRNLSSRVDLTLNLYETIFSPFFDYLKIGVRFNDRRSAYEQSSRSIENLQIPLSELPEAFRRVYPIAKGFEGTGVENNARWLTFNRFQFRENYNDLREFIAGLPGGQAFASEIPATDQGQFRRSREQTFAVYGMTHYRTKLLFPVDGIVGVRATAVMVGLRGLTRQRLRRTITLPNGTPSTVTIFEVADFQQTGQYFAVQPTATARVKFTPGLNLRLSYNLDYRPPSPADLNPFIQVDELNPGTDTFTGNPNLKPAVTHKYDAILEWYFGSGKTGLITVNPYYWNITGTPTRFVTQELVVPGLDVLFDVSRPYNAGKGYRRGVEVQGQAFFTFLPGILKNFGVSANYTFTASKLSFEKVPGALNNPPGTVPLRRVPRNLFNVQGLFESGGLNVRISYNWNGRVIDQVQNPLVNSWYVIPRDWMDAAINYTFRSGPLRNLSMSLQVQNALASARRSFYGYPDQPRDVIYQARTIGGRIGYKF